MNSSNLVSPSPNLTCRERRAVCLFASRGEFRSLFADILYRIDDEPKVVSHRHVYTLVFLITEKCEFRYQLMSRIMELFDTMYESDDDITVYKPYLDMVLSCKTLQEVSDLVTRIDDNSDNVPESVCDECGAEL